MVAGSEELIIYHLLICMLKKTITFIETHKFLLLIILLLVLIREGMVIFDTWTVKDGGDLPESLISGNFAFDILGGSWRGWDAYLYARRGNLGNELMTGIFALPLYFLFGNSLFVLCQVQIFSSLAILALMYYFSRRYFGETVANIASLLFVSFTVNIQSYLIYPYYLYFDNSSYTLLAFLIFVVVMDYNKQGKKPFLYLVFLGIVSGIGIFHAEIYILTIFCILFFWFLKDKRFFIRREFFAFLGGLVIGLSPSFYFGLHSYLVFFCEIFSGKINYAHDADIIANSYWTTLGLMSIGFWPIKTALFSLVNNQIITVLGIIVLFVTVFWKKVQNKLHLAFKIVAFYVFAFMLIAFAKKGSLEYYFHPLLVPTTIVLAVFIYNVQIKWFSRVYLQRCFYAVLFFICFLNIYEIARHFDFENSIPRLRKQLNINGCCYYWPNEYFRPDGFKSNFAIEVEAFGGITNFVDYNDYNIYKSVPAINKSVPQKKIYISGTRTGVFPLSTPLSYTVYGKDVSFAGLEQLAKEIHEKVPDEAKQYAYMGLAVYYVNDNWLKDLLDDFKTGLIDKNIPEEFQQYFYVSLAAKIFSQYYRNKSKIDKTIDMLGDKQKKRMLDYLMNYSGGFQWASGI